MGVYNEEQCILNNSSDSNDSCHIKMMAVTTAWASLGLTIQASRGTTAPTRRANDRRERTLMMNHSIMKSMATQTLNSRN